MRQVVTVFVVFVYGMFIFHSCRKEYSCENCRETNKPPIANAGRDTILILPSDFVMLSGDGSHDPDGKVSEWLWRKISGPASFTIITPSDSTTKVTSLVTGTYQFELKVTDNGGLFATDTVQITVNDPVQVVPLPLPPGVPNASCRVENLTWTLASNGLMTLINPGALAGTLDCAGYGFEGFIPSHYDVWVQFEGSSDWVHLDFVLRDAINSGVPNIFLSSIYYFDPNDGGVSFPVVYAKPNSGIDFTKKVTVVNVK